MSETLTLLEESDSKDTRNLVKGLAGAFGVVFSIVGGLACIILMNKIPPDFQLNSLRFIVGLTFALSFLIITRKLPKVEKKNIKWLITIAVLNLLYNIGNYSHYLKAITFVGTRSLQICAGIIFTLVLSKIILKDKISILKILVAVFSVSGVVLTLSAQSFVHSNCMQPRTISGFKNMSLSPTTSVKNNDREVRIQLDQDSVGNTSEIYNTEPHVITTLNNSAAPNQTETAKYSDKCHPVWTAAIAVVVISLGMLSGCMESITISGTGLREESPLSLSFWNYVFGVTFSLGFHFLFEQTVIPNSTTDIILYFGHATLASGLTYFDIIALQNIDVSLLYITSSLTLPLSFVLQLTILHNVSPSANMWLLVSGMIVVFVCAIISPIYEYVHLKDSKSKL